MVRRFVNYDGNILSEEEWDLRPHDRCFWCEEPLILVKNTPCTAGFAHNHEFVTLCTMDCE